MASRCRRMELRLLRLHHRRKLFLAQVSWRPPSSSITSCERSHYDDKGQNLLTGPLQYVTKISRNSSCHGITPVITLGFSKDSRRKSHSLDFVLVDTGSNFLQQSSTTTQNGLADKGWWLSRGGDAVTPSVPNPSCWNTVTVTPFAVCVSGRGDGENRDDSSALLKDSGCIFSIVAVLKLGRSRRIGMKNERQVAWSCKHGRLVMGRFCFTRPYMLAMMRAGERW